MSETNKNIVNGKTKSDALRVAARDAFHAGDFTVAYELSQELAQKNVALGLLQCGFILESGWKDGEKDLEHAYEYFRRLAITCGHVEGYLGCVRVKLAMKDLTFRDTAIDYCTYCVQKGSGRTGYILLGRVYEELFDPPKYERAKNAYINAVLQGSGWAMRAYARVLGKSGNRIGAIIAHVVTTILSPIFLLVGGMDTTRRG